MSYAYDVPAAGIRNWKESTVRFKLPRRLSAVLALLTAAVLAVTGCAPHTGSAAVVDGEAISVAHLQETVSDMQRINVNLDQQQILVSLIAEPFLSRIMAEGGVGVSESEARGQLAEIAAREGVSDNFGDGAIAVMRYAMLSSVAQETNVSNEIAGILRSDIVRAEIEVNPRYGVFNPDSGQIMNLQRRWLARER